MTTPKLYACMMLKNEEHNLHRCLSSIKDLCDKIIVVDTGSTDRTIEIAKEYGAIVFEHPWENDFSKHRNQGIQYCEELGADWFLIIDGDEELKDLGTPPEVFKQRLTKIQDNVHALGCQVHENKDGEFVLSFWGTRFFKAGVGTHYEGICHNKPKLINAYAAATNIVFYHYGYQDEDVLSAKRVRTLKLLDKRIAESPEEDYPAYYYRCMTLCGMDRLDEAIESGVKCLELLAPRINDDPKRLNFFGAIYYAIGWAYFSKWEKSKDQEFATLAYQWWHKGYEIWPNDIDLNYYLTIIGYLGDRPEIVKEHGDRYLDSLAKYKIELDMPLGSFQNSFDYETLSMGPRHIHQAQKVHEKSIRQMMNTIRPLVERYRPKLRDPCDPIPRMDAP
jgi:glycosyltransferase involved in cell wall biosynthesis